MDNTALYRLSYGVFMLGANANGRKNGCITNTCMQVANSPTRVAISVINTNFTCDLIKSSGTFALTMLSEKVTFDTIKHFGYQSGRDVDKITDLNLPTDSFGNPYLNRESVAYISCKVLSSQDLGSHTLFIAEIIDAEVLNKDLKPLTYADYQDHVKPKPTEAPKEKKIKGWRCKICGYIYEGETLPADFICPVCGHPADDFEPIYE